MNSFNVNTSISGLLHTNFKFVHLKSTSTSYHSPHPNTQVSLRGTENLLSPHTPPPCWYQTPYTTQKKKTIRYTNRPTEKVKSWNYHTAEAVEFFDAALRKQCQLSTFWDKKIKTHGNWTMCWIWTHKWWLYIRSTIWGKLTSKKKKTKHQNNLFFLFPFFFNSFFPLIVIVQLKSLKWTFLRNPHHQTHCARKGILAVLQHSESKTTTTIKVVPNK